MRLYAATALFSKLHQALGKLPFIAEDLGLITPEVDALREQFDLPGMRVLQFGFSNRGAHNYLPHRYEKNAVVYTGTHDNDTTKGWFTSTDVATTQSWEEIESERAYARRYLNSAGEEVHWDMIRLAFSSVADTAVIPLQDILGLDSSARMNLPGKAEGNWKWRFQKGQLDRQVQDRYAELTALYSRWNGALPAEWNPRSRPQNLSPAPAAGSAPANVTQTAP